MAYSGYLIKVISADGNTKTVLPTKYIKQETYKCTHQVLDLDSTRDELGVLHRNVLSHTAVKIEFSTIPMTNAEWSTFWGTVKNSMTDTLAKRVGLEVYDPQNDAYIEIPVNENNGKYGFYVPDIEMNIRNVDNVSNKVNYDEIEIKFIGY